MLPDSKRVKLSVLPGTERAKLSVLPYTIMIKLSVLPGTKRVNPLCCQALKGSSCVARH